MYSFPTHEKLCGQLRIAALYKHGKRFTAYPLRVTYLLESGGKSQESGLSAQAECRMPNAECRNPQILIWAPKSLFKRANKRNRLRRLMREAYRLNAVSLKEKCKAEQLHLQIAFNYIAPEELDYHQIEKAMRKALHNIEHRTLSNLPTF